MNVGTLEFARLLRIALRALLPLLAVPLFLIVRVQVGPIVLGAHPWQEVFWISLFVLLVMAYAFGQSLFRHERQDGALEYFLTFPQSRWALLKAKVVPRLLVLLLLAAPLETVILIHGPAALADGTPFSVLIDPLLFPVWAIVLFLLGMGQSLFEPKNLMAVLSILTLLAWGLAAAAIFSMIGSLASFMPVARRQGLAILASALILLLFFVWAFAAAYRRWDLFAPVREARPFLWKTLPPLGALALLALVQLLFGVF